MRNHADVHPRETRYLLGRWSVVGASSGTVGASTRLARTTTATARGLLVRCRTARSLLGSTRPSTITGTTTRNLDLARGNLVGNRGNLRLGLGALACCLPGLSRGMATAAGTAGRTVLLRCRSRCLASSRGAECVIALLARKMTATATRGSLALVCLACRATVIAGSIRSGTGARTTTTATRRLLVGRALTVIIAPTTALAALGALFATSLTRALTAMTRRGLGHQTIGTGKAIAHVEAGLAVKLHEGKRDVRRLDTL